MAFPAKARIAFLSSLAVLLLSVCLSAAAPPASWSGIRTEHFTVIGNAAEADMRRAAAQLERFRAAFHQLFPSARLGDRQGTRVLMFADAAGYRPFKPKRSTGEPDDAVSGYFISGPDVNYITLSADGDAGTALHEYTHLLLNANFSDVPPWLDEGLAEYFRTATVDGAGRLKLGEPRAANVALLKKGTLFPVRTLIEMDAASLRREGSEERRLFYTQSWALVHLLVHRAAVPSATLGRFLRGSGSDASQEFENIFGTAADDELKRYIAQRLVSPRTVRADTGDADAGVRFDVTASGANAYLGDLLARMDEFDAADDLLAAALADDPDSLPANEAAAMTRMRRGRFADAVPYFEKAVRTGRAGYYINFGYAYSLSRAAADPEGRVTQFAADTEGKIRSALKRSIEQNAEAAESYRLLALVDLVAGRLENAAATLRTALSQKPGDAGCRSLLGRVLLRQEKYGEAKEIALGLRGDPETRPEADAILRAVDEYNAASSKYAERGSSAFAGAPHLLFIKRSAVTDADILRFEEDRQINNLNRFLERPRPGEAQIVGNIDRITCSDSGIRYLIRTPGGRMSLTGNEFKEVRLAVLTEGERSFQIDCGAELGEQLSVITYRPGANGESGELTGITFVPNFFRLRTLEELAASKLVVIEDDTAGSARPPRPHRQPQ